MTRISGSPICCDCCGCVDLCIVLSTGRIGRSLHAGGRHATLAAAMCIGRLAAKVELLSPPSSAPKTLIAAPRCGCSHASSPFLLHPSPRGSVLLLRPSSTSVSGRGLPCGPGGKGAGSGVFRSSHEARSFLTIDFPTVLLPSMASQHAGRPKPSPREADVATLLRCWHITSAMLPRHHFY